MIYHKDERMMDIIKRSGSADIFPAARYIMQLENIKETASMYDANSLGAGATCGITEETKGTFRSGNEATKLEKALETAWKVPEYWKTSHSYISKLKISVDEIIGEEFEKSDRISISKILDSLKKEPYGFMPCNLTAFVLGFVLKEYANGAYSYSDNLTTVPLDADRLLVLSMYVFRISLKQKNNLGYIIGCACGITIAFQCVSNLMIVFGLLPMTGSFLPMISRGTSRNIVNYMLFGLILSIYRYKDIRKEDMMKSVLAKGKVAI